MSKKEETKFRENFVVPFLEGLKKCTFFSIQQMSISGTPDILACINGHFVALELKSLSGKTSKLQEHNMDKIRYTNGKAFVVTEKNFDFIKILLQKIDKGEKS